MTPYSPPFHLDNAMLSKVAEIAERLGQWKQASQAGLAIEHNSLSVEQVTAVQLGRRIERVGPNKTGYWRILK